MLDGPRNPSAGLRFDVLQPLPPLGKRGLVRYLASKTFEGIGETIAERIVDTLGEGALTIIREQQLAADGGRR